MKNKERRRKGRSNPLRNKCIEWINFRTFFHRSYTKYVEVGLKCPEKLKTIPQKSYLCKVKVLSSFSHLETKN